MLGRVIAASSNFPCRPAASRDWLALCLNFRASAATAADRNLLGRYMSTESASLSIPPNLHIQEPKVFEEEPEPLIPAQDYWFPRLDVPDSIPVITFNDPENAISQTAPLEKKIFEVAIRKDIVHDLIRYIRHKRRQPKKTKRISDIAGSNKKPRPQKGMGLSQAGHRRNSTWRGGAKAHGPVIRDYSIDLNRKVRALGMMMTLSAKFREGNLLIVDKLHSESGRTKDLITLLDQHGLTNTRLLFVDEGLDEGIVRASRNVPAILSMERRHLNVYEILKRTKLVIPRDTFIDIQKRLLVQYFYAGRRKNLLNTMHTLAECEEKWHPNLLDAPTDNDAQKM